MKAVLMIMAFMLGVQMVGAHEDKTTKVDKGLQSKPVTGELQTYTPEYSQCRPSSSPATPEELEISRDCNLLVAICEKKWVVKPLDDDQQEDQQEESRAFEFEDYFRFRGTVKNVNTVDQYLHLTGIKHKKNGGEEPSRTVIRLHPRLQPVNGRVFLAGIFIVEDEAHSHLATYNFFKKPSESFYRFKYDVMPITFDHPNAGVDQLPISAMEELSHRDSGGGTGRD